MKQNTNDVEVTFHGKPDLNKLAKVLNEIFKNLKTDEIDEQQDSEKKAG